MGDREILGTVADCAAAIKCSGSDDDRYRVVLGFVTDFWSVGDMSVRQAALTDEPPATGDDRWDAMLAAVTEHLAFHSDLFAPSWVDLPGRFLPTFWFPVDLPSVRVRSLVTSPASLARRGVFIDRLDLERV
jgi:hypothetical protein